MDTPRRDHVKWANCLTSQCLQKGKRERERQPLSAVEKTPTLPPPYNYVSITQTFYCTSLSLVHLWGVPAVAIWPRSLRSRGSCGCRWSGSLQTGPPLSDRWGHSQRGTGKLSRLRPRPNPETPSAARSVGFRNTTVTEQVYFQDL